MTVNLDDLAFRWFWFLASGERDVLLKDQGSAATSVMSFSDNMITEEPGFFTTVDNAISILKSKLEAAHNIIFSSVLGDYIVALDERGKITIENNSGGGEDTVLQFTDVLTTIPNGTFGFRANTTGIIVNRPLTNGVEWTTDYQANAQWIPYAPKERDTGDIASRLTSVRTTIKGLPVHVTQSDDYYLRYVRYMTVGAARMKQVRTDTQLFADAASVQRLDPNAAITNMIDHARGVDPNSVVNNGIYIYNHPTTPISDAGDRSRLYKLNLDESNIAMGVSDETLMESTALESYAVSLAFRSD